MFTEFKIDNFDLKDVVRSGHSHEIDENQLNLQTHEDLRQVPRE